MPGRWDMPCRSGTASRPGQRRFRVRRGVRVALHHVPVVRDFFDAVRNQTAVRRRRNVLHAVGYDVALRQFAAVVLLHENITLRPDRRFHAARFHAHHRIAEHVRRRISLPAEHRRNEYQRRAYHGADKQHRSRDSLEFTSRFRHLLRVPLPPVPTALRLK